MIAPNNRAALTTTAKRFTFLNLNSQPNPLTPLPSPIAHKEKTTLRGVRSVVFILYPVRDSNPCYRRERPAS